MSAGTEHKLKGCEIIPVLLLFLWIGCSIIGAILLYKAIPAWYGSVLGAFGGLIVWMIFCRFLASFCTMWDGDASPPCCRCGQKGKIFTELVDKMPAHQVDGRYSMICQCGERYLFIGRRVFRLDEQNQKHPYMYWRPMRGWTKDTTPENSEKEE